MINDNIAQDVRDLRFPNFVSGIPRFLCQSMAVDEAGNHWVCTRLLSHSGRHASGAYYIWRVWGSK